MTKQGRSGKLAEPTTLQMTTKLIEASKKAFTNQGVFIGIEKIDNNGNMKYTSTGLKTSISPWKEGTHYVDTNGMNEPYVCPYPYVNRWHDCGDNYSLVSVCEF